MIFKRGEYKWKLTPGLRVVNLENGGFKIQQRWVHTRWDIQEWRDVPVYEVREVKGDQ